MGIVTIIGRRCPLIAAAAAFLLLCGCLLVVADISASPPRMFDIPQFSLSQLKDPSPSEVEHLRRAISEVGLFAITDGMDAPSAGAALQQYAACVVGGGVTTDGGGGGGLHTLLDDGARKTTVAAVTNRSGAQPLPTEVVEACPGFADASTALRASVDHAGRVYARLLDVLVQGAPPRGPVPRGAGDSFVDAVLRAEALEHFHLFQHDNGGRKGGSGEERAIQLHSDMGLFIIMTAAQYVELSSVAERVVTGTAEGGGGAPGSGFYLELSSGEMVQPVIPPGSLLVMNGDGAEKWVRLSEKQQQGRATRPYSPAHEVLLPEMEGLARVWFGRMFLPPHDAVHVDDGELTFGAYRKQTMEAFRSGHPEKASSAGCSPHRRALVEEVTPDSCVAADEEYCWMSCMKLPEDAECGRDEIKCRELSTGKLWPDDFRDPATRDPVHCFDCGMYCPGDLTVEHDFCNTQLPATTMWMAGFQVASATNGCVAYLFEPWVLGTAGKFAAACIGTFLMGITVEFLVSVRRRTLSWQPSRDVFGNEWQRRSVKTCTMLALYAVQVTLGYLLMLVAMIYQVELFLMVVFGLMAGHGVFNLKARVGESADACCQGQDPDTDGEDAVVSTFVDTASKTSDVEMTVVAPCHVVEEKPPEAPRKCCSHVKP